MIVTLSCISYVHTNSGSFHFLMSDSTPSPPPPACDNTLVCSPTDLWHALEQYRAHCPVPGCRYTTEANVFLLTQGNITLVCDADMNVQPPANNCAVTNVASNCLVMLSVTASYPYTETLVSWDSINLVQLTGDGWDPDHVAQVLKTPNADLYGVQLSNTGLSTLNIDTFSQLTNLCALGLGQNQLTTLPEGLFTATTNLQMLFVGKERRT